MSEIWLPDTPAYVQLRPPEPEWLEAQENERDFLVENLGVSGEIESVQYVRDFPFGRYRILDHDPPLYIKILPASRFFVQQQSQKVADWLNSHNLLCPRQITRYSKIIDDRYLLLAFEYFDGRFAEYSVKDIFQLGKSVRKLHRLLSKCPWGKQIERKGEHRLQVLKNILVEFQEGTFCNSIPEEVKQLLLSSDASIIDLLNGGKPQVVHGDLNYGNVLFPIHDGSPMLCDFEDTMTAWFPTEMENAFIVERFILAPTDNQSIVFAKAYCSAYVKSGARFFEYPGQLELLLKSLAVRALLLLSIKERECPHSVQQSEWLKFNDLYKQAEKRSSLLCEISQLC